jgi:hypothetical protein
MGATNLAEPKQKDESHQNQVAYSLARRVKLMPREDKPLIYFKCFKRLTGMVGVST